MGVNNVNAVQISYRQQVLNRLKEDGMAVPENNQLTYDQGLSVLMNREEVRAMPSSQRLARNIDADHNGQISVDELAGFFERADRVQSPVAKADGETIYNEVMVLMAQNAREYFKEQGRSLPGRTLGQELNRRIDTGDFSVSGPMFAGSLDLLRQSAPGYWGDLKAMRAVTSYDGALSEVADPKEKTILSKTLLSALASEGTLPFLAEVVKDTDNQNYADIHLQHASKEGATVTHYSASDERYVNLKTGRVEIDPDYDYKQSAATMPVDYSANPAAVTDDQKRRLLAAIEQPQNRQALQNLYEQSLGAVDSLQENPQALLSLARPVKAMIEGAYEIPSARLALASQRTLDTLAAYIPQMHQVQMNPNSLVAERNQLRDEGKTDAQIKEALGDMIITNLVHELGHSDQYHRAGRINPHHADAERAQENAIPERVREYGVNARFYISGELSQVLVGSGDAYLKQPMEADANAVSEAILPAIKAILQKNPAPVQPVQGGQQR